MYSLLFLLSGILIGVVIGLNLKRPPTNDDPTGEIKQAIFDKLNKIIEDVKSTV